jgi:hypothetical protein
LAVAAEVEEMLEITAAEAAAVLEDLEQVH